MGLIASKKSGAVIPPLEDGTYTAVCIGIVDLGEQLSPRFKNYQDKVSLTFEVVGETVERGNGPEPRWISREYTKSLGEKANLCRDLTKWLGALSEEDAEGLDLTTLLGRACLISVVQRERADGSRANNVEGVMALPKGMPQPRAQSQTFLFDMDKPETYAALDTLPQFLREKVEHSPTWARLHAGAEEMGMDEDGPAQEPAGQSAQPVGQSAQTAGRRVDPETGEILRSEDIPF